MTHDIDKHITIINAALAWAREYGKNSFPAEQFKNYRRELAKIRGVLSSNCSAAAYGESQVGKSYLMSSLLSSADCPFEIENGGRRYSFIDELNPSGGNNAKIESTGVITRFTTSRQTQKPAGMIRISNLSVLDIILLLADSYYNDIKIDPDKSLSANSINTKLNELASLWSGKPAQQDIITEDDILDINDYIREVIGNAAAAVYQSNFCKVVAPVICRVPHQSWPDVFSLLWNQNAEITRLFTTLINAYEKIGFRREVYVPFDAVLRSKGTLLKIEWLDTVCGTKPAVSDDDSNDDVPVTDIYDAAGQLVARDFNKGELSALIAELTFELPTQLVEERKFLNKMDLLDFPGARSREKYKESEIATVLPRMLRRGKVAYLFNKYSRSQQIGCVLFCHHNDQKAEPTIGDTINSWIEDNIGKDAQERTRMLQDTRGISPLFLIATKFNIDLERTKTDKQDDASLDKHWNRFDTVLPEIVGPSKWLDEWTSSAGVTKPFQSIYPLRDFYWSAKNGLFDGYSDGEMKSPEKSLHIHPDYPGYMDCLRRSFLGNQFVRDHFASPEKTWDEVATLNNDGSKPIIRDLGEISGVLDEARRKRCLERLVALKKAIDSTLRVYYDDTDDDAKDKKVRAIAGEIRLTLTAAIARDPATFGGIIDRLMVGTEAMRNIAYDIIVLHTDTPRDFNNVNMIRANAGIDTAASRQENIQQLLRYNFSVNTEDELREYLKTQGTTVDEVISGDINKLATIGGVVTKHVTDYWIDHLNRTAAELSETLPRADDLVFMLASLFSKLGVGQKMAERIDRYTSLFGTEEQINAIGDYASLTLNSFVSTVGREYMPDSELENLRGKADRCNIPIDLSPSAWNKAAEPQPLEETLRVFDDAAKILNSQHVNMDALRRLPFWSNYYKWENLVFIGLLYSSDISRCDPVSNGKVRDLIDRNQALYSGQ